MRRKYKLAALTLVHVMLFQALFPGISYCITSGPAQPEYSSFTQINVDELVDVATGDFKYSIPLMEVPGRGGSFPLALNYSNSLDPETEASMVGLGWSLNLPAINRQTIGYPDDFNGSGVKTLQKRKPNINIRINGNISVEGIGIKSDFGLGFGKGVTLQYNNILGIGFSLNRSITSSFTSKNNITVSPTIGLNLGNLPGAKFNSDFNIQIGKKGDKDYNLNNSSVKAAKSNLNGYRSNFLSEISLPIKNSSTTLSFQNRLKGGVEVPTWGNGNLSNSLSFSESKIDNNGKWQDVDVLGAYHLDSDEVKAKDEYQLDFYRFNNYPLADYTKNLSVPVVAKDKFVISNGLSVDNFCVHYEDPVTLRDREVKDKNFNLNTEVQADFGAAVNVGLSVGHASGVMETNALKHELFNDFDFFPLIPENGKVLQKYFRLSSNFNQIELREIENNEPLKLAIKEEDKYIPGSKLFKEDLEGLNNVINTEDERNERQKMAQVVTEFTNGDVQLSNGIIPQFDVKVSHSVNGFDFTEPVSREFGLNKFTGFIQRDNSGNRYIYSLPVLSLDKWDVAFGVDCDGDCDECSYFTNYNNAEGEEVVYEKNKFKDIKRTFKYAESFLMTAIVGIDYIDVDPTDGLPNEKDRGYWVRFDYSTNTSAEPYIWRAPFYGALVTKNINGFSFDDHASFSAGKREQYYLQKITTATHYAKFTYKIRKDGRGAGSLFQKDKNFGQSLYAVEKIQLFDNEFNKVVKTANLSYDYSLCSGVLNNPYNEGKLTLKAVQINNLNSGFLPPYTFDYYGEGANYSPFHVDRWGAVSLPHCNNEFNYTPQEEGLVRHWHLKSIDLPSGSKIEIDVSRDHYGNDEYLKPGQMYSIEGIENEGQFTLDTDDINKILFKKDPSIPIDKYFEDLYENGNGKQVYFNVRADVYGSVENIEGYANVKNYGEIEDDLGFVELRKVEVNRIFTNEDPILANAWHKLKNEYRRLKYDLFENVDLDEVDAVDSPELLAAGQKLVNNAEEIFTSLIGHYRSCKLDGAGTELQQGSCFIRLTNPTGKKFGGNLKVDRILYKDTSFGLPNYGKVYQYEGGVVNTEPLIGKEENIKNVAINTQKRQRFGFAWEDLFEEKPDLSLLNKVPTVVYSRVKVKSLASDYMERKFNNENIDNSIYNYNLGVDDNISCTGYTLYEHYTAKDFPTYSVENPLDFDKYKINYLPLVFINFYFKYRIFSQGYSVTNNDMHGKTKRISSFAQSKTGEMGEVAIAETVNEYENSNSQIRRGVKTYNIKKLSSSINENNIDKHFGKVVQNAIDVQYVQGINGTTNVDFNTDVSVPGIPIPVGTLWPYVNLEFTKIGVSSGLKTIHQKGIMKKVLQTDFSNSVDISFDQRNEYTGQGNVTISTDEFSTESTDNNKFSLVEPAYKTYKQLESANVNYNYYEEFLKSDFFNNSDCLGDYYFIKPNSLFQVGDILHLAEGDKKALA